MAKKIDYPLKYFAFILIWGSLLAQPVPAETIHFWTFWSEAWLKPSLDTFEKLNPGIHVEVERLTYQEGRNKIVIAFAAGEAPDLLELGSTWSTDFIQEGYFSAIPPEKIPKGLYGLNLSKWNDQEYALPWFVAVSTLFYNKKLLEKAGFSKPPQDWAELYAQAHAIHQPKKRIYGFGLKLGAESLWQKFLPFAWANAGELVDASGSALVNQFQFVQAVDFVNHLKSQGLMDDNLRIRNAFLRGQVGFMFDDAGQIGFLQKNNPNLSFGVAPWPAANMNKPRANFGGAQLLAINRFSKHQSSALKLLLFLTELNQVRNVTDKVLTLYPAQEKAWQDTFYTQTHPELHVFLHELPIARSAPVVANWILIQKKLVFALEQVFYGVATPQAAMDDLALKINALKPIQGKKE